MKAVILAAGVGTRLRPITDKIPKVMVRIGDKPLLHHHIDSLKSHGITDIWINLHYLPEVIQNYFGNGTKFGVRISYSYEKELLGTAGALKNTASRIEEQFTKETFLIVYGDNFTNINYTNLIKFHRKNRGVMTIGLYKSDEPWNKGIVETDLSGKVITVVEKPAKELVTTDQVNAGIYVCESKILDYIPDSFSDFGFDVIPSLLNSGEVIWGFVGEHFVQDAGTFRGLRQARNLHKSYSDE